MMIKYNGWRVLPGEIVLTELEYVLFAERYQSLSKETKDRLNKLTETKNDTISMVDGK
jgi:hypothetical protein